LHCGSQKPLLVAFVRSVNVGVPVCTLSLRKNRAGIAAPVVGLTAPPTPTYIRVSPFASLTTSNSARSTPAPVAGLATTP
jgi:hypothetical protein